MNPAMTNETLTRSLLNVRPACSCGNCDCFAMSHSIGRIDVGECRWPLRHGEGDPASFPVTNQSMCDKWEARK